MQVGIVTVCHKRARKQVRRRQQKYWSSKDRRYATLLQMRAPSYAPASVAVALRQGRLGTEEKDEQRKYKKDFAEINSTQ